MAENVGRIDKKMRSTGGNMRLASCGVKWLNSSLVFQLEFCGRLTVQSSEIPHERQAANRYVSGNKRL